MQFSEFKFHQSLSESLDTMGFEAATPIQEQAIPIILSNQDMIACAQTGTGKTAAFLLPIINKLCENPSTTTDTLVVVPTRELALQIDQVLQGFSYYTQISSIAIYGGSDGSIFDIERKALETQANIIIATPGRLIAHLNMGYVRFSNIKHFVLDEADRMLDMGFIDDIIRISTFLPKERETLMFSATMPPKIRELAKRLLVNPQQINIAISKPAEGILQACYLAEDNQKNSLIRALLTGKDYLSVLIFSGTKLRVKELVKELKHARLSVGAIHSDLEQAEREEVLRQFRNHEIKILVATDILSRGIDIEDIGLVVNYDVPGDAEDYVHRVGRTARAESTGVAITFVNHRDRQRFKRIEELIEMKIHRLTLPSDIEPPVHHEQPRNDRRKPSPRRNG